MAESADNRSEMPFLDHLEELRWRILYSLLAIVLGTVVGWVLVERVDIIGLLTRPIAPLIPGGKLRVTSPTDPFFITLKFAFLIGLVLASPVVGYQAWAFLVPALYPRERRLIVPALSAGALLFLGGAAAAYFLILPRALAVLLSFQQGVFDPLITADKYFAFAGQLILAFGIVTELPLVIVILAALGLVTSQFLARNRRYAIVISAVAAALLAPPDAISMLLMMFPLWGLYEVGIWCAWVVERRRARRARASAASAAGLIALLLTLAGSLGAQTPPIPSPRLTSRPDTAQLRTAAESAQARPLDTAIARKLGLPSGPTRSFPPSDAVIDSLMKLKGFRVTQYVADTLVVQGGDTQTIHLRGEGYVEREGTKLEADTIRYRQRSCRLDAVGDPRLFDKATVMVGEGMKYDTCVKRGTVSKALTSFQQGAANWLIRGDLAVDSGSTRLYGAHSDVTSDDNPVPDYHFATGEMKWLNKNVMVARPAVLYVHDVPIMWLPFIFQDVRKGRRSGILVPRFGLNDIVRPVRSYQRHLSNFGYYFVVNDYVDFLVSGDWYASRYFAYRAQTRYRWLDRFIDGGLSFERFSEFDAGSGSIRLGWQHQQSFSSRTRFNANIDYTTNTSVIQTNTVNPYLATASLHSALTFIKQFDWGTLNVGGNRSQEIGSGLVSQTFPSVSLTPSPVNIGSAITWSPGFSFQNAQSFHQGPTPFVVPGTGGALDTLALFADSRQTSLGVQTPLRIGSWNWSNDFTVNDVISNARQEIDIRDSTVQGGRRRVLFNQTFSTTVDWNTGINLPSLFSGTWKLQPGVAIVNQTSAGPYMIRNQFTNGDFVQQGKRLQFSAGVSPTFFGFFPGFGPIARIRHSISPIISYAFAPGATVSEAYRNAIDPAHQLLNSGSDPQQTISLGLSQNLEAKMKPPAGDTTTQAASRKLRLLSINTSSIQYNFEQAKQPGHTGWQTQTLSNSFGSDLLPGFSLSVTHDLWRGQVGVDTAKFDPFLTSVTANFSITPATIHGIGSLFGLGKSTGPPAGAPAAAPPAGTQPQPGVPPNPFGRTGFQGPGTLPAGGGGQGFNLSVNYTESRARPVPPPLGTIALPGSGEQRQAGINLSFQPSPKWSANWTSQYDFVARQFGLHIISLQRDLHRWHASFSFTKNPNGNFAFSFYVSLLDQPDIKFNYEQQSFTQ
ncbi:MAG TPA: twin-arginine translocase subunit TatC [Gemmatimonadales bacterium]|nr:twin-arginine translocase subunit TatC [Gemmatimonadales bacterium]